MTVKLYGISLAALLLSGLAHPAPEPSPAAISSYQEEGEVDERSSDAALLAVDGDDAAGDLDGSGVGDLGRDDAGSAVAAVEAAPAEEAAPVGLRTFTARLTAYAPGCGDSGLTRTGTRPTHGTVAVDPSFVPLYSRLTIDGLPGIYQALDTGGGVRGAQVDVWQPDCHTARQFGVQTRTVTVLAP